MVLFAAGIVLRVLYSIAYGPALMFSDSWRYIAAAWMQGLPQATQVGPAGYPALIEIVTLVGRDLAVVVTFNHFAGLATAGVAFLLLRRLGVGYWLAFAATAVLVLDASLIALEQHVLAEAPFALALTAAAYLSVGDRGPLALVAAGGLLIAASGMRLAGVFAIPVWLLFVLWRHREPPKLGGAAAGLLLPVLAVAAVAAISGKGVGVPASDGWFLYGRIAQDLDCRGLDVPERARGLCQRTPEDSRRGANYHMFNPDSPARQTFGYSDAAESNRILRAFAIDVILDRPLAYVGAVGEDFARFFWPESRRADPTLTVPRANEGPRRDTEQAHTARDRETYASGYTTPRGPPAGLLEHYETVFRIPPVLMVALLVASLAAIVQGVRRPMRGRAPEVFLLTGVGVVLLLGGVAVSDWSYRYMMPALPLLLTGGCLALRELATGTRWWSALE